MREKMIPGRIDHEGYKQITLQSDYDREGKLIVAYDSHGDVYIQTEGYVRFANISSSMVGKNIKEHLKDLVNDGLSDVKIGTVVEFLGKRYVCQPALSDDQKKDPDEECEGCAFFPYRSFKNTPCTKYYCADIDRGDHIDVRFVEKGGKDE